MHRVFCRDAEPSLSGGPSEKWARKGNSTTCEWAWRWAGRLSKDGTHSRGINTSCLGGSLPAVSEFAVFPATLPFISEQFFWWFGRVGLEEKK